MSNERERRKGLTQRLLRSEHREHGEDGKQRRATNEKGRFLDYGASPAALSVEILQASSPFAQSALGKSEAFRMTDRAFLLLLAGAGVA
jgi:hypothetical protein